MPFGDPALNEYLELQSKWENIVSSKLLPMKDYVSIINNWITFKNSLCSIAHRDKFGMQLDTCGQHQIKAKELLANLLVFFSVASNKDLPDALTFQERFIEAARSCPLSGSPLSQTIYRSEVPNRIQAAQQEIKAKKEADRQDRLQKEQQQREAALARAEQAAKEWLGKEIFYQHLFTHTINTINQEKDRIYQSNPNDNRIALLETCRSEITAILAKTQADYADLNFTQGKI